MQVTNLYRLNLNVNDTDEEDEKLTIIFEASNDEDVVSETYIDIELSKNEGLVSYIGKQYNEFKLRDDKKSDDVSFGRAVKMTMEIFSRNGLFDN